MIRFKILIILVFSSLNSFCQNETEQLFINATSRLLTTNIKMSLHQKTTDKKGGVKEKTFDVLLDISLELFNVEVQRSGRGHLVFITGETGNPVRYPIRLSEFEERPRFHLSQSAEKEIQITTPVIDEFRLAQWARDLNRLLEKSRTQKSKNKPILRKGRGKQKRY